MAFTLPELPFAKDALAPHISAETLDFHQDGDFSDCSIEAVKKRIEIIEPVYRSIEWSVPPRILRMLRWINRWEAFCELQNPTMVYR